MAGVIFTYYKNDGTSTSATAEASSSVVLCSITDVGSSHADWTRTGYVFVEWNSLSNGSGTSFSPGDTISYKNYDTVYAIWEEAVDTVYKTTESELTSIANAIRTKGGTSASLEYPTGFVSAINDISTGGGSKTVTISLTNPVSASSFQSFTIYEMTDNVKGSQIGSISSPSGSTTVQVSTNQLYCELRGGYIDTYISTGVYGCSGDVGFSGYDTGTSAYMKFIVAGDGAIDLDNIDWDD